MTPDPRHAALVAAERELEAGGAVSPATARRVMDALGLRQGAHDARLRDRDDAVRALAEHAAGSPWARAGAVAAWLARWAAGDPLHDAPRRVSALCHAVGEALSRRQVYRILRGDRGC